MRDSMVFYRSFADAIRELEAEEQLSALWAILDYGLKGIEPDGKGAYKAIYMMAKPQIDVNNKRYQNGTKGGRPKTDKEPSDNQDITIHEPSKNQDITIREPNVNDNENVNDNKNNIKRTSRFVPPTRLDIAAYCEEKGYKLDIDRFIDFYESKGWMVGKNKMKDWRAAVRNWSRNSQRQGVTTKSNSFNNFNQRDNDYSDLQKQLLQKSLE